MLPFVVRDFFRRRPRKRRANDVMPTQPLVDLIAFWFLIIFGGLFGGVALVTSAAALVGGVDFDRGDIILFVILGILCPLFFAAAMPFWDRMNH